MKNKLIVIVIVAFLFFSSCGSRSTVSSDNSLEIINWIISNEQEINTAINQLIINEKKLFPTDTNWLEKGKVVTRHDSSILGNLAKLAEVESNCIYIVYSFTQSTSDYKTITFKQEIDKSCPEHILPGTTLNLKYFNLENAPY